MSRSPSANTCPVCKAKVEKEKLVPIYARGRKSDPREETVPRPRALRPETPAQPSRTGWDQFFLPGGNMPVGNGITVGFGLFPSLFGMHYVSMRTYVSPSS